MHVLSVISIGVKPENPAPVMGKPTVGQISARAIVALATPPDKVFFAGFPDRKKRHSQELSFYGL
jgi:hypothetical protein